MDQVSGLDETQEISFSDNGEQHGQGASTTGILLLVLLLIHVVMVHPCSQPSHDTPRHAD